MLTAAPSLTSTVSMMMSMLPVWMLENNALLYLAMKIYTFSILKKMSSLEEFYVNCYLPKLNYYDQLDFRF